MELVKIKQYLNKGNKLSFDKDILSKLKILKGKAVESNNEDIANEIWCLETISEIQRLFISAFYSIKDSKYFDAWYSYAMIDIKLSFLRKHYDYGNNKYNLEFIEQYSRKYQELFPYEYFMSRESIIKKECCSICGRVNTIRNHCEHEVGELYMGKMCTRNVLDMEFLGTAIVKNPFDKYTVIFPEKMEYNYEILDTLFLQLNTPYDRWILEKEKRIKSEFKKAQRNKPCPCGSGKKYKKCCYNTEKETIIHNKVTLLDNPNVIPVSYKKVGTWKNNKR